MNVGKYIATRLKEHGVEVLFGIPGTSCADFFDAAIEVGMRPVLTSSELEAGYAADGYARFRGLAAVTVSYGVGTLSLINAIAGAYTERSPVVVINGGPSLRDLSSERFFGALYAHSTGRPAVDIEVFAAVTAWAARASSASEAQCLIDTAICIARREQRPVYLEVPSDLWKASCSAPSGQIDSRRPPAGTEDLLASSILERVQAAERPAVLLGVEIDRYNLADQAKTFLSRTGLPWATTLLAKSVLPESTPGFVGTYDSDLAPKPVRAVIEGADLLLALGCVFGVDHATLLRGSFDRLVAADNGQVRIGRHETERGELGPLLNHMANSSCYKKALPVAPLSQNFVARRSWRGGRSAALQDGLTHEALFETIDAHLDHGWIVVIDTCLGSYPAADLSVRGSRAFLGNPVWLSIGHSIGAAVGVALAQTRPVLVICGDGGFQMMAQGLSTMARHNLPVTTIVIDNGLYAIEQYLLDPKYFIDLKHPPLEYVVLHRWDYTALAQAMGQTLVRQVTTTEELAAALSDLADFAQPGLISARILQRDLPPENRI